MCASLQNVWLDQTSQSWEQLRASSVIIYKLTLQAWMWVCARVSECLCCFFLPCCIRASWMLKCQPSLCLDLSTSAASLLRPAQQMNMYCLTFSRSALTVQLDIVIFFFPSQSCVKVSSCLPLWKWCILLTIGFQILITCLRTLMFCDMSAWISFLPLLSFFRFHIPSQSS